MDSFDVGTGDDDVPLISEATTDNRKKMTVRLLSGAIAIVFVVVVVSVGVSTSHHKESTEANTEFIDGTCYENNDFHLGRDFLPLNDFHESVTNTPDECIRTCRGYSYAGVQNKKECFCGNYEPPASRIKDSSECDAKCPGNASFTCGGDWRMNIYSTVKTDDFINGACYEDCIDGRQIMAGCGRILEGFLQTYSQITVEKCKAICQDKGFLFAGLEQESWCGCGNEVPAGHEKPGECNMACNGDSGQICGDTSRINIYRTSTIVSTVWSKGLTYLRPTLGSGSEAGTLDDVSLKLSGGVNAQTCKTGVIWSIRDWKKSLLNNIAYKDTDHDFDDCGDFEADGSPIGFTIVKPGNDSLKLVNMEFDIGGEIYVWSGAAWWDPTHPVLMATWQELVHLSKFETMQSSTLLIVYFVLEVSSKMIEKSPLIPSKNSSNQVLKCYSRFCIPNDYDKDVEPPYHEDTYTVYVNPWVMEIYKIDDMDFSIHLLLEYQMSWIDNRIVDSLHDGNTDCKVKDGKSSCQNNSSIPSFALISHEMADKLWKPKIGIQSLKNQLILMEGNELMKIDSGSERWIMIHYKIRPTITCKMEFFWYPFDSHTCLFVFISHISQINLETELQGAEFGNYMPFTQKTIPEFNYTFHSLPKFDYSLSDLGSYKSERVMNRFKSVGASWTTTGFTIKFTRKWIKQLFLYYLPSSLFVMASWVSFLVPPEVIPGRMSLLVTLFLSLTTLLASCIVSSPAVSSGVTALIAWIVVHYFFLAAALAAYAFLLALNRFKKVDSSFNAEKIRKNLAQCWDTFFIFSFPIVYIIFNIIYWSVCLASS